MMVHVEGHTWISKDPLSAMCLPPPSFHCTYGILALSNDLKSPKHPVLFSSYVGFTYLAWALLPRLSLGDRLLRVSARHVTSAIKPPQVLSPPRYPLSFHAPHCDSMLFV